ncbi:MAG: hypothetical protein ABR501_00585 [Pyrinomonadaceae bacterium]
MSCARELAEIQLHPAAITWMVIFSMATLFGSIALLLRFWSKMLLLNRDSQQQPKVLRSPVEMSGAPSQLPPHLDSMPSVTEHTTRTFGGAYKERSDFGER